MGKFTFLLKIKKRELVTLNSIKVIERKPQMRPQLRYCPISNQIMSGASPVVPTAYLKRLACSAFIMSAPFSATM